MFWLAYGEYNGRRAVKPFVRYFIARYKKEMQREMWERYVADSINYVPQQKCLAVSYSDIVNSFHAKEEGKTAEEIIDDIMTRHGLSFKKSGE